MFCRMLDWICFRLMWFLDIVRMSVIILWWFRCCWCWVWSVLCCWVTILIRFVSCLDLGWLLLSGFLLVYIFCCWIWSIWWLKLIMLGILLFCLVLIEFFVDICGLFFFYLLIFMFGVVVVWWGWCWWGGVFGYFEILWYGGVLN